MQRGFEAPGLACCNHETGLPSMRRLRLCYLVGKPQIGAAHVVDIERKRCRNSSVDSGSRLDFNQNLQRRVQSIEQTAEAVQPARAIGFGRVGKTDGAGFDDCDLARTSPQRRCDSRGDLYGAQGYFGDHAAAATTSASSLKARLAGASGNAITVASLMASAWCTHSSSGMRPAACGP